MAKTTTTTATQPATSTSRRYATLHVAYTGLTGLPERHAMLSITAAEMAAACRACAELDLTVTLPRDLTVWEAADQLSPGGLQPGPREPWQAFHRAIAHLQATLDDPARGFSAHADAYHQLAEATDTLATSVKNTPRPSGLEQCWFCGQTNQQVDRLIAGDHAAICSECVELCNEVLG